MYLTVYLHVKSHQPKKDKKFFEKYLVVNKKCYTFVLWRGGRVVDCGGLENRCTERYPGFESLSLRKKISR